MTFPRNPIGNTGIEVTTLSFGGSSLGNLGGVVSDADCNAVMDAAWSSGIRYFDTAPHYGRGLSEQRMGQYLRTKPWNAYTISSKVGRVLTPGTQQSDADGFVNPLPNDVHYDYSAKGILASFDGSCDRLGVSKIDIVFVHDIGDLTHGKQAGARHLADLFDTGLPALHDLKAQGRIGAIGLGVNETQICLDVMKSFPLDVILLAGRLTLLDRDAENELLDVCAQNGTQLILGGIFNSGILATGPVDGATFDYAPASPEIRDQVATLQTQAEAVGLTLAQASIQFALRHPAVISTLIGTGKVRSLIRNLDAAKLTLTPDAVQFVTR
ncbi:aldo/keto reductase [Aestuariibius sp. HNIBRBA575]|uniref:aldo/keto reductase n=1 Tax=Aestuariibius sp. HNIBRBA575 TaxID=3233343 RepID=UPI0034A3FB0E